MLIGILYIIFLKPPHLSVKAAFMAYKHVTKLSKYAAYAVKTRIFSTLTQKQTNMQQIMFVTSEYIFIYGSLDIYKYDNAASSSTLWKILMTRVSSQWPFFQDSRWSSENLEKLLLKQLWQNLGDSITKLEGWREVANFS